MPEDKKAQKQWYSISASDELHDRHGAEIVASVGASDDGSPTFEAVGEKFRLVRGEEPAHRELYPYQALALEKSGFIVERYSPPSPAGEAVAAAVEAAVEEEPKKKARR